LGASSSAIKEVGEGIGSLGGGWLRGGGAASNHGRQAGGKREMEGAERATRKKAEELTTEDEDRQGGQVGQRSP
jgi:hypothetical protein